MRLAERSSNFALNPASRACFLFKITEALQAGSVCPWISKISTGLLHQWNQASIDAPGSSQETYVFLFCARISFPLISSGCDSWCQASLATDFQCMKNPEHCPQSSL